MDLKLFFSTVEEQLCKVEPVSSFFKSISVYEESFPDLKDLDIAIIGITEARGGHKGVEKGADLIRNKLYHLKKGSGRYRIADLGNLRPGVDREESIARLKEVCEYLIQSDILPVIIGGTHDMDTGQYRAYQDLDKLVSVLNVDARLDMQESGDPNRTHTQDILLHDPNYLFNYSHLAYQSYLIEPRTVEVLEKLYFEAYRVGHLRTNISEMEPVIRNADMLSFDISSIKSADAPGTADNEPFGLTGEEACQISWYAGHNQKLSTAGFYEYNPEFDDGSYKTAGVVATMIWYFIEGYYSRKDHHGFKSNDYLRYVVSMGSDPDSIQFFKSKLSEKWWMEVPSPTAKSKYGRNCIVPCSYEDYQVANSGEVPERYISTLAKLV